MSDIGYGGTFGNLQRKTTVTKLSAYNTSKKNRQQSDSTVTSTTPSVKKEKKKRQKRKPLKKKNLNSKVLLGKPSTSLPSPIKAASKRKGRKLNTKLKLFF